MHQDSVFLAWISLFGKRLVRMTWMCESDRFAQSSAGQNFRKVRAPEDWGRLQTEELSGPSSRMACARTPNRLDKAVKASHTGAQFWLLQRLFIWYLDCTTLPYSRNGCQLRLIEGTVRVPTVHIFFSAGLNYRLRFFVATSATVLLRAA